MFWAKKFPRLSFIKFKICVFRSFHTQLGANSSTTTQFRRKGINWMNWLNLNHNWKHILIHVLFRYCTISYGYFGNCKKIKKHELDPCKCSIVETFQYGTWSSWKLNCRNFRCKIFFIENGGITKWLRHSAFIDLSIQ